MKRVEVAVSSYGRMFVFNRRKRVSLSGCYGVQMLRGNGIGRDKQWTFMIDFGRWSRSFDGRKWLVRRDPRRSKGLCRINSRSFRLLRPSHWSQNVIEDRRGVSYVIRGQRTRWLYSAVQQSDCFWQSTFLIWTHKAISLCSLCRFLISNLVTNWFLCLPHVSFVLCSVISSTEPLFSLKYFSIYTCTFYH